MWRERDRWEAAYWSVALGLAAVATLGWASCQDKGTDPHSESSQTRYFPLDVGNRWVYDDTLRNVTIAGAEQINGQTYYVHNVEESINYSPLTPLGEMGFSYYRIDDENELVFYDTEQEQVMYKFSASVGESWTYRNRSYGILVTLLSSGDTVRVPAGEYEHCMRFRSQVSGTKDLIWWDEWFAPSVGAVRIVFHSTGRREYTIELVALYVRPTVTRSKE